MKSKFKFNVNSIFPYIKLALYIFSAVVVSRLLRGPLKSLLVGMGFRKSDLQMDVERKTRLESVIEKNGLDGQTSYEQIKADASEIGHAFGVTFPWYHPRSWTENEDAALIVLKRQNPIAIPLLSEEYKGQFDRDLQRDCIKYLSAEQWADVRYLFL